MRAVTLCIFAAAATGAATAAAASRGHLLPARRNFDALPEVRDAKEFAKACEEKLYDRPNWIIRYYQVIAVPTATTAISIGESNGAYWLAVRQARPSISALPNFTSALKSVRVKKLDLDVPVSTARQLIAVWRALLRETKSEPDRRGIDLHSPEIVLYGKDERGLVSFGKYPPNADEYPIFIRFSKLIDDVLDTIDKRKQDRPAWLHKIEEEAQSLNEALRRT